MNKLQGRSLIAARRRAAQAEALANRKPTPENKERAQELKAGLERMEAEARA